jgi:hypothetical protein
MSEETGEEIIGRIETFVSWQEPDEEGRVGH